MTMKVREDLPETSLLGSTAGKGGAIEFSNVGFRYSTGLQAISNMNLNVAPGRTIGIVGPSGCGKSTVLSLIAGLREATSGEVRVTPDDTGRHLLSMVFQKDTVLPWLTVEQNVRIHHSFKKSGWRDKAGQRLISEKIRELISMVHLDGFEKAYPYQLSGGMRRRVAVLTSVAAFPQVLLLDEPFSAIDEPSRVEIHQDVFNIIRELGITTVLVTHDLAEAASLCDEVYIMGPRPTFVFSRHDVGFGEKRDMMSLRAQPEFLDLYGKLWSDLKLQIESSKRQSHDDQRDGGNA